MATSMTPQQQAAAARALLNAIKAHKSVSYVAAGSVTTYLYDFLLTFPDEVKYMWTGSLGLPKVLFFVLRYYTLVHIVFAVMYHVEGDVTGADCIPRFTRDAYSAVTVGVLTEAITYVRVYAFSGRNPWVGGLVLALFLGTHAAQYYFLATFMGSLRFANLPLEKHLGCIVVAGKTQLISGIFVTILCGLTIATVIMIYFGWKGRKHAGGMRGLMKLFYNDGIFYFISLSTLAMANIIVIRTAPQNGLQYAMVQVEVHVISLLAGRMLVHLRQWGQERTAFSDTGEYSLEETRNSRKVLTGPQFATRPVSNYANAW